MSEKPELIKRLEKEIGKKLKQISIEYMGIQLAQGFDMDENDNIFALCLDKMGLDSIPQILSEFKNLEHLSLYENQLTDLNNLEGLLNLRSFNINNNRVTNLNGIKGLENLEHLELINNQVTELPKELLNLSIDFDIKKDFESIDDEARGVFLYGNPLKSPPVEIIKQGRDAIQNYFASLKVQGEKLLNEVKVLLVGAGGSGKTSLVKRILGEPFDPVESQTDGINIVKWMVPHKPENINVNIWDFGGQQIMHATHQFFLSKRSLYILVLDNRKDEDEEYWLKHIESFGGNSPVLVVINKIDENRAPHLNRKFLKEKYKYILDFFRLSCRTNEGIESFISALQRALCETEIIKNSWPAAWFSVKEKLESMTDHYISRQKYQALCSRSNVVHEYSRVILLKFLHDLGIVLHFDDLHLANIHVLEPHWVTQAVYRIITSDLLADSNGLIELSQLRNIFIPLETKTGGLHSFNYPDETHGFIIELMKKFELCYSISETRFLVPDLLITEEPEFQFGNKETLHFIIQYDFLPRSVMPRFIVRRNADIKDGLQWRTGVVLEDLSYGATAVVKADERERKIDIAVMGEQKRDYFSTIRKTLQDINSSFERLDITELVPLPGSPRFVSYNELIGHELDGREDIYIGEERKSYPVRVLLDGVMSYENRRKESGYQRIARIEGGDVHVHVNQNVAQLVKQENKQELNIQFNLNVELPDMQDYFVALKEEMERSTLKDSEVSKQLEKMEDALYDLTLESDKKELRKPMGKLRTFLKNLGDEDSTLRKVVDGTEKGIELAQKVGKTYNKFAKWLALPQVPDALLGEKVGSKEWK